MRMMPFIVTDGHPLLSQSTQHIIYDFLLALNSNLTSIFNHFEISHLICTSLPCGTGKRRLGVDGHALVLGCLEHWTIQPKTTIN